METPTQHPNSDCLRAFALGTMDEAAAPFLREHLKNCPRCAQSMDQALAAVNPVLAQDQALMEALTLSRLKTRSKTSETPIGVAPQEFGATRSFQGKAVSPTATPPGFPRELLEQKQFQILRRLGAGGMGVVYLAHNLLLDRDEALKVMQTDQMESLLAPERFMAEMRAASRLNHPNIVTSYSACQWEKLLVFCMEYVPGETLASFAEEHHSHKNPFPLANACYYAYQTSLGLQHAHEKGMVHRDIKPANLMLFRKGHRHIVKILDFGLAKATSEDTNKAHLTVSGQALGTPHYMAPEQIRDASRADIRADIYSLGCTLYHLLSGHPPFEGKSVYELLEKHIRDEAPPIEELRPDVPSVVGQIVRKMMAKDPNERFQTPAEVAKALNPFFHPDPASKKIAALSPNDSTSAKPSSGEQNPGYQPSAKKTSSPSKNLSSPVMVEKPSSLIETSRKPGRFHTSRWLILCGLVLIATLLAGASPLTAWYFQNGFPPGLGQPSSQDPQKLSTKTPGTSAWLSIERSPWDSFLRLDGVAFQVDTKNGKIEIPVEPQKIHTLEIRKDGFEPWTQKVLLDPGARQNFRVQLTPTTPQSEKPKAVQPKATEAKPAQTREERIRAIPFRQLFDGRTLDQWILHPKNSVNWKIDPHGILVGDNGPFPSPPLVTRRSDYRNFHLRMETRISNGTHGSIHFGVPADLSHQGIAVQTGGVQSDERHLGDLNSARWNKPARQIAIEDNEWFLLEILVNDSRVTVMAKGQVVNEYQLDRPVRGALAVNHHPGNQISIRSMEIKEWR